MLTINHRDFTRLRNMFSVCRQFISWHARIIVLTLACAAGGAFSASRLVAADPPAKFELRPGDHISLVGNTLAERMQHDGWLETILQSRFAKYQLVIRNLGYSGDELTIRLRSAGFGSPDDHLKANGTDVVFAFFGYNESFAGQAGLDKFKADLEAFIKHTLGQKYNGKSPPRLVLFSPIAHEYVQNRNLPDGRENNLRIEMYTQAMTSVARANGVPFVDLFQPTFDTFGKTREPLTINGIHLTESGNQTVAMMIDRGLFPDGPTIKRDAQALERIREAVVDKNFYWFNRYRTVDGYSIFGGRADLAFVGGQTNRVVMQRELEVLDVMTANRDKRIWAVAQGKDYRVDDSNTPEFIPVTTNKPGPGPGGTHLFLDGEEAIKQMQVADGMKVSLFASEKEFPDLANPVQMAFDTRGRLWVTVMPSYPHWKPKEEMNDKVLILEDTNGDGRADVCKVFADHLHVPTGLEFYNGGVFVGAQPDLMFLKDTDGDDKADIRFRMLHGIDSADTHHALNSFTLDPGGALYFQEGTFHHTQVETPYGPPERCANAGVYRYEPRTQKFDVYVSYGFANPHGHVFDRWGQDIVTDGTGANPYHAALFSGHVNFPNKHAPPPQVYQQRTRPCPGTEYLSSRHFPDDMQGSYLVGNVIGFQGILRYRIDDKGASFSGTELESVLQSTDASFRPTDLEIGPDGAIWFTDWQNPIIGHMQHNLRDPSRDRTHGRVYRITYPSRPLLKPAKIAGEPIEKLLALLKEPEDRVRYRAKIELGARDSDQVIAAVQKWLAGLDKKDPEYEHHMLEGLWVHQYHNVINVDLLKRMLASTDFRARAAATRVLCYWRDRIPETLEMLKQLAADAHPRVRLEAIRAASFFTEPEAVEVPLVSADLSTDIYLDYTRNETLKTLEPYWKKALAEGQKIAVTSDAGARFLYKNLSTDELLKMQRNRGIFLELLLRKGVRDENRREAVAGLARLENKSPLQIVLGAIQSQDDQPAARDESIVFDLVRLLTGISAADLQKTRGELVELALGAKQPITRQVGYVALVAADGSTDKAWKLATGSTMALRDFVNAMPMIADPGLRAELYPRIEPLLNSLPENLSQGTRNSKGTVGRFVRIELAGKRTLTLAEVEVNSDGKNIARQGKASQKNTAHGGDAKRAIDGNKSASYGDGGQTHTEENTTDPWWEVDLGDELPIESVVIHNRIDGDLGQRLDGFTLKILDGRRAEVFAQQKIPAPKPMTTVTLESASPESVVRRAAMLALTSVRGQEAAAFKSLARFVREGEDRASAVQALLRIPATYWSLDEVRPLVDSLTAHLRKLSAEERTSPAALDVIQLGYSLAALLPADQAKLTRKELGELGVQMIRIGTLTDQMLFDRERIVVQAGKPVEFVFENTDIMPHNFVITQEGALEEIGLAAEAQATQPGAIERHYVPASNKIILASQLLQPRQSQKLRFTAPAQAGMYPYVCTYPGHWRRMYGALFVVADLDEYQADPEAYLAAHPLSALDPLLKFNRPRKEWRLEELAGGLEELEHGRSFGNAKQMFQVANCVACHKLNGVGQEVGPDLVKLDPKLTPLDILKEMLEPSARINEKFQSFTIETEAGKVYSGLIVEETPELIKVLENPLLKADPVVIKIKEIVSREKSKTSIMPRGLFDKLTREEILDLLAYVIARGDQKHAVFQRGHEHKH